MLVYNGRPAGFPAADGDGQVLRVSSRRLCTPWLLKCLLFDELRTVATGSQILSRWLGIQYDVCS